MRILLKVNWMYELVKRSHLLRIVLKYISPETWKLVHFFSLQKLEFVDIVKSEGIVFDVQIKILKVHVLLKRWHNQYSGVHSSGLFREGPQEVSSYLFSYEAKFEESLLCYVAVCNNYAICNTLQTALNCNAVCNTSYFKLRCDGNAICNVLQIASKFYHLKILKKEKKFINGKMHRLNHILLWIQLDTNLFELGMQNNQSTLHLVRTLFVPTLIWNWGGGGNRRRTVDSVVLFLKNNKKVISWLLGE